eukprot:2225102-Prymnesium_polylepis.1
MEKGPKNLDSVVYFYFHPTRRSVYRNVLRPTRFGPVSIPFRYRFDTVSMPIVRRGSVDGFGSGIRFETDPNVRSGSLSPTLGAIPRTEQRGEGVVLQCRVLLDRDLRLHRLAYSLLIAFARHFHCKGRVRDVGEDEERSMGGHIPHAHVHVCRRLYPYTMARRMLHGRVV